MQQLGEVADPGVIDIAEAVSHTLAEVSHEGSLNLGAQHVDCALQPQFDLLLTQQVDDVEHPAPCAEKLSAARSGCTSWPKAHFELLGDRAEPSPRAMPEA
jgi:hypothetical protein